MLGFEGHSTKLGHGEGTASEFNEQGALVGHLADKRAWFKRNTSAPGV